MYKVTFHFSSSHKLDVEIHESRLDELMRCFEEGTLFMNDQRSDGIWIQRDKVIYYEVQEWDL